MEKQVACIDCKAKFMAGRGGALRCLDCRVRVKLEHNNRKRPERHVSMDRELACQGCGRGFQAHRSDAKWCAECSTRKAVVHGSRHRADKRRVQSEHSCKDCGSIFRAGSRAGRCEECRRLEHVASVRRAIAKSDKSMCPKCGAKKSIRSKACRACSDHKVPGPKRGAAHPNWKGGRFKARGYWFVRKDSRTYAEHRLVWEEANGPIPVNHIIHHVNGDGLDNRLENLECLSRAEHRSLHDAGDQRRDVHLQDRDAEIARLKARLAELEAP